MKEEATRAGMNLVFLPMRRSVYSLVSRETDWKNSEGMLSKSRPRPASKAPPPRPLARAEGFIAKCEKLRMSTPSRKPAREAVFSKIDCPVTTHKMPSPSSTGGVNSSSFIRNSTLLSSRPLKVVKESLFCCGWGFGCGC